MVNFKIYDESTEEYISYALVSLWLTRKGTYRSSFKLNNVRYTLVDVIEDINNGKSDFIAIYKYYNHSYDEWYTIMCNKCSGILDGTEAPLE